MTYAAALGVLLLFVSYTPAQISDTQVPQLVGLTIAPDNVDVRTSPMQVTVRATVTDDLSGTEVVVVRFHSPSGQQSRTAHFSLNSGTPLDGVWEAEVTFPQFIESGTWTVADIGTGDAAGNAANYTRPFLESQGLDFEVEVLSTPDTEEPQLVEIELSPDPLTLTGTSQSLEVRLRITDDLSGVDFQPDGTLDFTAVYFSSPSGGQIRRAVRRAFQLVEGTELDGVWSTTVTFPAFSESGQWSISTVLLIDAATNITSLDRDDLAQLGLTTTLRVNSTPEDIAPPVLRQVQISPAVVDTSTGAATVTVNLGLTDDLAGVDFSGVYFTGAELASPSGMQRQNGADISNGILVSGSPLAGRWDSPVVLPQFSETGTWRIERIRFEDAAGNYMELSTSQLMQRGFPVNFVVFEPSFEMDGSIGPAGGTVEDDAFGDLAQVALPPGAVDAVTAVTIDVLETPENVATPAGFVAPGSRFVNFEFTPEPDFPLPAPGASVVLPLENPLPPGMQLNLFHINESGNLQPSIGVDGFPVIGAVQSDGLSALFEGIAHFSVLVALLPVQKTLYFAQLAGGGGFEMELLLTNASANEESGRIDFLDPDGFPLPLTFDGLTTASLPYAIPPGGVLKLRTQPGASVRSGYAVLQSATPGSQLTALLVYEINGIATSVPPSAALTRQHVFAEITDTALTAAALANPGQETATIRLLLLSEEGQAVFESELPLMPGEHRARFLNEIFPELAEPFQGSLQVISTDPVIMIGLRQNRDNFSLTTLSGGPFAFEPDS